jgi:excisionase family DNA binding protein
MNPQLPKLLYTKAQTCFALGLGQTTIDSLVIRKELKPIRIGRRVMFSTDELQRFIKKDHPTGVELN